MRMALLSIASDPSAAPGRPGHGAQGAHIRGLAAALARAGHEVVVEVVLEATGAAARRATTVSLGGGARVRRHELGKAGGAPRVAEHLQRVWRRWRPDVVHAHSWLSGMAAAAATRTSGLPLVVSFHGAAGTHQAAVAAERTVADRAGRILAGTADESTGLTRRGVDGGVIRVVPYGVDTEAFAPSGRSLRRGERPRLVTVGSLHPDGGVYDVVSALRWVRDAELLVAGGPVTGDPGIDPDADPELAALRAHAGRTGVLSRVRLLGAVGRDVLPALLRSADVVVHVPRRDVFAAAALETMACERAVVASSVGTLRDVVVDGVTGRLVPPSDPARLGRTLSALLARPTMLTAFGIAGRDRAESRFSWQRVVPAVEAAYEEARAAPHGRRATG